MKISELIHVLERIRQREGDITVVAKNGKPLSFVDVEESCGKLVYPAVKHSYADPR